MFLAPLDAIKPCLFDSVTEILKLASTMKYLVAKKLSASVAFKESVTRLG